MHILNIFLPYIESVRLHGYRVTSSEINGLLEFDRLRLGYERLHLNTYKGIKI